MPQLESREIGLAVDMFGCPNRCRHCYLGQPPNGRMSEEDLRWVVQQFRTYCKPGDSRPFFESINVVTWQREPDFCDNYKRLYELEVELSDTGTYRHKWELLSIWRLARDEQYAPWAKSIGVDTCQITFFGRCETQDWFYRRKGAFQDCMVATDRLLDAGIKPRWQLILTKKMVPELDDLLKLADTLKFRERCQELGSEFIIFIHTPAPDGEARFIEHLRPTLDEVQCVPSWLVKASEEHMSVDRLWKTVGERVQEILDGERDQFNYVWYSGELFFIVQCGMDVYTNKGSQDPWWKLGNLRTDSLEDIVGKFESNGTPGLHTISSVPLRELARRYGDPKSRLIDGGVERLWLAQYCEELGPRLEDRFEDLPWQRGG